MRKSNLKLISLSIIFFLIVSCSPKQVTPDQLVERQGIFYLVNSDNPFNGKLIDTHENDQLKREVNFINGLKEGQENEFYENGQIIMKTIYLNGKKDGLFESFHTNGQLSISGFYKAGEKIGEWQFFYPDGNILSLINYKDDDVLEVRYTYHSNGKIQSLSRFRNELKHGIWESYFSNGNMQYKSEYQNDLKQGIWESYFEDGSVQIISTYKDDNQHGLTTEYFQNGKAKMKANYKNGLSDGLVQSYYESGTIKFESTYIDGEQKSLTNYNEGGRLIEKSEWINYYIGGKQREVSSYNKDEKITKICSLKKGVRSHCKFYCPDGITVKESITYDSNGFTTLFKTKPNKCQENIDAEIPWRNSILDYIGDFQPRISKVELSSSETLSIDYTCEGVKGLNRKLKVRFKDGLGELESIIFGEYCSSRSRPFSEPIYTDGDRWMKRKLSRPLLNALSSTKNPVTLIEEAYLEINGIGRSSDIPENINPESYPLLDRAEELSIPITIEIQLTEKKVEQLHKKKKEIKQSYAKKRWNRMNKILQEEPWQTKVKYRDEYKEICNELINADFNFKNILTFNYPVHITENAWSWHIKVDCSSWLITMFLLDENYFQAKKQIEIFLLTNLDGKEADYWDESLKKQDYGEWGFIYRSEYFSKMKEMVKELSLAVDQGNEDGIKAYLYGEKE